MADKAERRSHRRKTLFKALVEHFIPRLVADEEETKVSACLLVQPAQLLLWQQGAQLLNNGVQLVRLRSLQQQRNSC